MRGRVRPSFVEDFNRDRNSKALTVLLDLGIGLSAALRLAVCVASWRVAEDQENLRTVSHLILIGVHGRRRREGTSGRRETG